jgi:anaerobic selenocysteine-containing dehydrogenase
VINPADREAIVAETGSIVREIRTGQTNGIVAVVDRKPGRVTSDIYRRFVKDIRHGLYLVPEASDDSTLATIESMASRNGSTSADRLAAGFDLEHTRTILSFGAPILDGWGTPGRVMNIFRDRSRNGISLIQIETRPSLTALQADTWLQPAPDTEFALALGLASVIISEGLYTRSAEAAIVDFAVYLDLTKRFDPRSVSLLTGIAEEGIVQTARKIANGPSIVIAGSDPAGGPLPEQSRIAIASLNILLGNVGKPGGILYHREVPGDPPEGLPPPRSLESVPDHSIRLLILDGSDSGYTIPVGLLEKKLDPAGGKVLSLSSMLTPLTARADFAIPSPAHLESLEDISTPPGAIVASFGISPALLQAREEAVEAVEVIRAIAAQAGMETSEFTPKGDQIRKRIAAIHALKRGVVVSPVDGSKTEVSGMPSPDVLWEHLFAGGFWQDELRPETQPHQKFATMGYDASRMETMAQSVQQKPSDGYNVVLMPFGVRGATSTAQVSPVLSKLFQESGLRSLDGEVYLNHETARLKGITDGDQAVVRTTQGEMTAMVRCDSRAKPGVVHVAVGPRKNYSETSSHIDGEGILMLCSIRDDGTWRATPATIEKG